MNALVSYVAWQLVKTVIFVSREPFIRSIRQYVQCGLETLNDLVHSQEQEVEELVQKVKEKAQIIQPALQLNFQNIQNNSPGVNQLVDILDYLFREIKNSEEQLKQSQLLKVQNDFLAYKQAQRQAKTKLQQVLKKLEDKVPQLIFMSVFSQVCQNLQTSSVPQSSQQTSINNFSQQNTKFSGFTRQIEQQQSCEREDSEISQFFSSLNINETNKRDNKQQFVELNQVTLYWNKVVQYSNSEEGNNQSTAHQRTNSNESQKKYIPICLMNQCCVSVQESQINSLQQNQATTSESQISKTKQQTFIRIQEVREQFNEDDDKPNFITLNLDGLQTVKYLNKESEEFSMIPTLYLIFDMQHPNLIQDTNMTKSAISSLQQTKLIYEIQLSENQTQKLTAAASSLEQFAIQVSNYINVQNKSTKNSPTRQKLREVQGMSTKSSSNSNSVCDTIIKQNARRQSLTQHASRNNQIQGSNLDYNLMGTLTSDNVSLLSQNNQSRLQKASSDYTYILRTSSEDSPNSNAFSHSRARSSGFKFQPHGTSKAKSQGTQTQGQGLKKSGRRGSMKDYQGAYKQGVIKCVDSVNSVGVGRRENKERTYFENKENVNEQGSKTGPYLYMGKHGKRAMRSPLGEIKPSNLNSQI